MPADKVAEALDNATAAFRDSLISSYDLDDEVVDAICDIFKTSASPLAAAAPKRSRAKSGDKKQTKRRKSAYNVYVREQMRTDEIKAVPHKEKMGQIALSWKTLSDEEKEQYQLKANEENDAAAEVEIPDDE